MSVFTAVSADQASAWLKHYTIGHLSKLEGIAAGIENTNYFLTTTHGEYVLTLFEKLTLDELPYYVNLMAHLAQHGIQPGGRCTVYALRLPPVPSTNNSCQSRITSSPQWHRRRGLL